MSEEFQLLFIYLPLTLLFCWLFFLVFPRWYFRRGTVVRILFFPLILVWFIFAAWAIKGTADDIRDWLNK